MQLRDTIVAISTPLARSGIGVVRLSGDQSRIIAGAILRFPALHEWSPWTAALAELTDHSGAVVDQVVVTFFAAPRSYTAEDVVEISCHGSPVVLGHCVERAVGAGARLAEPGEFTLRAYLNGRIDLPQAEAVRDLIDATTLYQARVAAQQAGGLRLAPDQAGERAAARADCAARGRHRLRRRRRVGRPGGGDPVAYRRGARAAGEAASSAAYGKLVHSGFTLAIVGRPNVGKSSLFNALLGHDRAIVTEIPGTTRDTVSEAADIGGIPVRLVDTAGIRSGQDRVEQLGIERSFEAMADADLTIVVFDASRQWKRPIVRSSSAPRGTAGSLWRAISAISAARLRTASHTRPCRPSPARVSATCERAFWKLCLRRAWSGRKRASSPACGMKRC